MLKLTTEKLIEISTVSEISNIRSRSSPCFLSFIWVLDFPRTLWIKGNYVKIKHNLDNPVKVNLPIPMFNFITFKEEVKNILCADFRETVGIINIFHSSRKGKTSPICSWYLSIFHLKWQFQTRLFTVFILKLSPSWPYKTKLLLKSIIEKSQISNFRSPKAPFIY